HARSGLALRPETSDQYPLTSLSMIDSFDAMPFISLTATADFQVGEHASLSVSGSYDHYFPRMGDTTGFYETELTGFLPDSASVDFTAFILHAGIRMRF